MDFDDIVIGAGLAGLGAVLGLLREPGRRVAVLCGPDERRFGYYDARRSVPCAYLGHGGLGSHWHGVIPTGLQRNFAASSVDDFAALFARFYPHADVRSRLGTPSCFVPWRPIRPARELRRLAAAASSGPGTAAGRLTLIPANAETLKFNERGVSVVTPGGGHRAARAWVAAGALHTPDLMSRSLGVGLARGCVSDHAFCYVGQVDGLPPAQLAHTRDGVFFPAFYDAAATALYMLRPARFGFRVLDHGIEQRAAFGLPTGSALAKIARRLSPGLLAEAIYNRLGLDVGIGGAQLTHSVYAQVPVPDAYRLGGGIQPLQANPERLRAATDAARAAQPFAGLRPSRRPEVYLPGIHLHHSLDLAALTRAGVNGAGSPVQIVDASVLTNIGPDHHSFKMLLAAHERARR